jgi:hypothetical protein
MTTATLNNTQGTNGALAATVKGMNPFDNTVLFSVCVRTWGVTRKIDSSSTAEEAGASADLIGANKKIIQSPEYDAAVMASREIGRYMRRKMVPGAQRIFKGGVYPVAITAVERIDAALQELIATYQAKVEGFLAVYTARRDETMLKLGKLADASDYPTPERLRREFQASYSLVTLAPAQNLTGALNQREADKFRDSCREAALDVKYTMRTLFQGLLKNMTERLTADPVTGRKKKLYDTMTTNTLEFLADFSDKNVVGDGDLAAVVERCQALLGGKTTQDFRDDDDLRAQTAVALTAVKDQVDKLVFDMPARKVILED